MFFLKKNLNTKNTLWKLLYLLEEESDSSAFFYTTDDLASYLKISPPNMKYLFKKLKEGGYNVTRTHFKPTGFKTDASLKVIEKVFKQD